ncbi:U6 snRNA phosphodiesterase 1-like [Watersipora subatra]|uniref:U6 snRNA phosphodiesterase 1-like n=1 Tax=Watersipora subatra TaxID=2589382 RepID=UPI00355B507C
MHKLVEYSDSDDESADEKQRVDFTPEELIVVDGQESKKDQASEAGELDSHQGRIRSFPHERGNWASYVCIPVPYSDDFEELSASLTEILRASCTQHSFHAIPSPHISLTRTLKLRHHWLADLTQGLLQMCSLYKQFYISLRDVQVYTNDEKSRTFISVKVVSGDDHLTSIVHKLNSLLTEYNLPPFYQEASFHVSLCSCVHDARVALTPVMSKLQNAVDEWIRDNPECAFFSVNKLLWKAGNKETWLSLDVS